MNYDAMKALATCSHCHKPFIDGEEGEGYTCDKCRDILLHNNAWDDPQKEERVRDVV